MGLGHLPLWAAVTKPSSLCPAHTYPLPRMLPSPQVPSGKPRGAQHTRQQGHLGEGTACRALPWAAARGGGTGRERKVHCSRTAILGCVLQGHSRDMGSGGGAPGCP